MPKQVSKLTSISWHLKFSCSSLELHNFPSLLSFLSISFPVLYLFTLTIFLIIGSKNHLPPSCDNLFRWNNNLPLTGIMQWFTLFFMEEVQNPGLMMHTQDFELAWLHKPCKDGLLELEIFPWMVQQWDNNAKTTLVAD